MQRKGKINIEKLAVYPLRFDILNLRVEKNKNSEGARRKSRPFSISGGLVRSVNESGGVAASRFLWEIAGCSRRRRAGRRPGIDGIVAPREAGFVRRGPTPPPPPDQHQREPTLR